MQNDAWDRLARAGHNYSINHSTRPLDVQSIVISIETTVPDSSIEEAIKVQLSVWARSFVGTWQNANKVDANKVNTSKVGTTLPVVQVNSSIWTLLFLRDGKDMVQLIETVTVGDTRTFLLCYQVVAFLRHLDIWALPMYNPWCINIGRVKMFWPPSSWIVNT